MISPPWSPKWSRLILILWICLGVAAIASQSYHLRAGDNHQDAAARTTVTDWIIAGSAALYAVFAYFQWRAIREQAEITKNVAEATFATERPWVEVGRFTLKTRFVAGQHPVIEQTIVNVGRTPAFVLGGQTAHAIAQTLPPHPTYPTMQAEMEARGEGILMAPMREVAGKYVWDGPAITQEQINDIRAGNTRLWVYGYLRYRDALKNIRETGYCYILDPHPQTPTIPSSTLAANPEGIFRMYGPDEYRYHR